MCIFRVTKQLPLKHPVKEQNSNVDQSQNKYTTKGDSVNFRGSLDMGSVLYTGYKHIFKPIRPCIPISDLASTLPNACTSSFVIGRIYMNRRKI